MPAQNCVRLNDAGQTEQARPKPGHPNQQCAVTATQPQTVRCTPQGNIELMPKKKVLDFKPARAPEPVGNESPKQMEDGKHRVNDALILLRRVNPPGWNFQERQVST